MNGLYQLPTKTVIGGRTYELNVDFRDILEIFTYLEDPQLPDFLRWKIALALFYRQSVPQEHLQQALAYLCWFVGGGMAEQAPGPKLLDWQTDAPIIISDINKVACQEIRGLPFVHWWTFLSWFLGIREGQLSTLVGIRSKLRKGKALEPWEKEYYRENRAVVDMKKSYTSRQLQEKEELIKRLDAKEVKDGR